MLAETENGAVPHLGLGARRSEAASFDSHPFEMTESCSCNEPPAVLRIGQGVLLLQFAIRLNRRCLPHR